MNEDNSHGQSLSQSSAGRLIIALRVYVYVLASALVFSWISYSLYPSFDRRPFFAKNDEFMDLLNYIGKTAHLRHSSAALGQGFPTFAYSPPSAFLWHALFLVHAHPLWPYIILVVLAAFILATVGIRACSAVAPSGDTASGVVRLLAMEAIALTALMGWPLWYAADRGNLEGLTWALSGGALCFFLGRRYRAAAVCIGLAACIKPFPLAFCALLLLRRRYWETALAAGITVALILAACIGIEPNPWKAYQDLKPGFGFYSKVYVQSIRPPDEVRFSHSILDGLKLGAVILEARKFNPTALNKAIQRTSGEDLASRNANPAEFKSWPTGRALAKIYPFIALAVFAALVFCARGMPALNQITILGIAAATLPPNAFEYTLLNLYVPFGALVIFLTAELARGRAALTRITLFAILSVYALLFAPLTFLRTYAGVTKLLLILLLLAFFIRTPMPTAYFGDKLQPVSPEEPSTV